MGMSACRTHPAGGDMDPEDVGPCITGVRFHRTEVLDGAEFAARLASGVTAARPDRPRAAGRRPDGGGLPLALPPINDTALQFRCLTGPDGDGAAVRIARQGRRCGRLESIAARRRPRRRVANGGARPLTRARRRSHATCASYMPSDRVSCRTSAARPPSAASPPPMPTPPPNGALVLPSATKSRAGTGAARPFRLAVQSGAKPSTACRARKRSGGCGGRTPASRCKTVGKFAPPKAT